ncbi:beta-galactosidase [Micromonospora sp. NPDC051300]|uniref:beta-galactosidase n=1 Tax=Micromonospora sp. NPDC051300 TaxID=3364286 RepID=UPI00378E08AA
MHFGTSYYPEHWPAERWPDDLRLMRAAGMTVVRLGDFAWSRLEPSEGDYDLDWLASAVDLAAAHGLRCVLATPTAGPPIWLTDGHPDVLAIDADGRRRTHGNRTHASLTNGRYRAACVGVAEALARRFGRHPAVLGWQIDNEVNTVSYDETTRGAFQRWLADRYGTIETLNDRWGTVFWSQEYRDFAQIPLPVGVHHPSLMMAWRRFLTDMFRAHLAAQSDVVRRHADPAQWISHNVMTWYDHFDHHALAQDLDLVGLDLYVGHVDHPDLGAAHDATRGLRRRNHWVMETQPGHNCWSSVNNELDAGEARRLAWQAVGHGADGLLYWQWRPAPGGQEQYHGTLLRPDGEPRPFFAEAARIGAEFGRASTALAGTQPQPRVAVLQGYEDRWAIENQRHHQDFDPVAYLQAFYRPIRLLGHDVDIVAPDAPLDPYRLVVAPSLHTVGDAVSGAVTAWVEAGGHLVVGVRTGMKDAENVLRPSRQPGPLSIGVAVDDYYALERPVPVVGALFDDGRAHCSVWAETLSPLDPRAEVLARYGTGNGWLDGAPAVVTVPLGAGRVTYVGAWLEPHPMARLMAWVVEQAGLAAVPHPPGAVEVCRRVGGAGQVVVVLNHGAVDYRLNVPGATRDLLADTSVDGGVEVPAGDVRVLWIPAGGTS